jgi:hypothetical protein
MSINIAVRILQKKMIIYKNRVDLLVSLVIYFPYLSADGFILCA